MTLLKNLHVAISALAILAVVDVYAQVVQQDLLVPPAALPVDVKNLPPQSPAAPTSAGALVIKFEMEMIDKDRDGFVSRAEASGVPMLAKVFSKFDRNRDNKLDRAELEAAEQAQPR